MNKEEIKNLIKELIEQTNVSVSEISVTEDSGGTSWFSVVVDHPHLFSLREGEGLNAINHLVRRMIEAKNKDLAEVRILVDINNLQKKRVESVQATAHMMAERARYFKSSIEVDPMSAFERRIVHEFLSNAMDLKTESIGEGRNRRVVIKYTGSL